MSIIESESKGRAHRKTVLRLGGFHTLMSFLGAIGYVMAGSGLHGLLEQIYAETTVTHMLAGKAYERAFRGHMLVDASLNTIIANKAFGSMTDIVPNTVADSNSEVANHSNDKEQAAPSNCRGNGEQDELQTAADREIMLKPLDDSHSEALNLSKDKGEVDPGNCISNGTSDEVQTSGTQSSEDGEDKISDDVTMVKLCELKEVFDALLSGKISLDSAVSKDVLQIVNTMVQKEKNVLRSLQTSQLWLQYMEMVDILRNFVRSERTGDWKLHLQTLRDMLSYLAAAGHNAYTKSIHVYLQRLDQLPLMHPEVQKHFDNGLHVVWQTDRYWAGLSTDLVIEQVLMRSVKSTGGLTRGRGIDEIQRLLLNPVCTEINSALQEYTSVQYATSDQHKESKTAHQHRDTNDTCKLLAFLQSKNPFDPHDERLYSIDTGVIADQSVNVEKAADVGRTITDQMIGHGVQKYVFRKKDQVLSLEAKASVHTGTEFVVINPLLLFQRLVSAGSLQVI